MIKSITIAEHATYINPVTLDDLTDVNFFYGANGAGKSTIGRIINSPSSFEKSTVTWNTTRPLKSLVYNQEFIEKNFTTVSNLKGVYTLGEEKQAELALIEEKKSHLEAADKKLEALLKNLNGDDTQKSKEQQLSELEDKFTNECWSKKKKYDEKFSKAFEGYRGSAVKFREKILKEHDNNKLELLDEIALTKLSETIFVEKPQLMERIPSLSSEEIISLEDSRIFKKPIIGKNDIDFANLIKKLNNSDWIRQGISHLKKTENVCPFCQQSVSKSLERKLSEYFDETFEQENKELRYSAERYNSSTSQFISFISTFSNIDNRFLNSEILELKRELLAARFRENLDKIKQKINEPSIVLLLDSSRELVESIETDITTANLEIEKHNTIIKNHSYEEARLKSQIWRFTANELISDIDNYLSSKQGIEKTILNLKEKINVGQEAKAKIKEEIAGIEKQSTSIEPTVEAINSILKAFGFNGFKLETTENNSSYKIVRPDGSNAKATLSEGEKTFLTFLYFFHLLKGSEESSGLTTEKVVVIDDPVSSLDNDVLFIISTLIKETLSTLTEKKTNIKQLFILTHNIYFFKEVTYRPGKPTDKPLRSFWIVRKADEISSVERFTTNPIKTSYDLLWSEFRRKEKNCNIIQNSMRRILENYFKILGGRRIEDLVKNFEGKEKAICNSLISWTHDGSHCISDDLYAMTSDSIVDRYQKVFFKIFKAENHLAHYEMMMGDDYVDLDQETADVAAAANGVNLDTLQKPINVEAGAIDE